jgi:hypothetical protein
VLLFSFIITSTKNGFPSRTRGHGFIRPDPSEGEEMPDNIFLHISDIGKQSYFLGSFVFPAFKLKMFVLPYVFLRNQKPKAK